MEKSVLTAIERFSLLEESRNITVALSGGADSVSLLYVLFSLKDKLDISLSAAHLNHMIRGEEADRDEEFVKEFCKKLNIPLFSEKIDVPTYAKAHKLSLELAAREVRYEFLNRVNNGLVATAHTASDNLETMLFNLTRGTALKGLCGIPPKREIFIRPLILSTRAEVEEYCKFNNLEFVTDSTNLSDKYTRNNIRHNVIPVLKQINPSVEKTAVRTAASVLEDNDFLEELANKFLLNNTVNNCLIVSDLPHPALAKRIIKRFVKTVEPTITLENKHITDIYGVCHSGGKVSIPLDMSAVVKDGMLSILGSSDTEKCEFTVKTECRINDLFTKNEKINSLLLNNLLDCDKIMGKSVIRTRLSGDSIRLQGRGCTKTLKKLMSELKIPQNERDNIPVIADDKGVVWCHKIGVAARCAVTKKTKNIMLISVNRG